MTCSVPYLLSAMAIMIMIIDLSAGAYGCILDLTCYLYMLFVYCYIYLVTDGVCDTRLSHCLGADHSTQVCFIILVMLWYCKSSGLVIDSCVPVFLKSYSLLCFSFIHDPFLIPFILISYRYDLHS